MKFFFSCLKPFRKRMALSMSIKVLATSLELLLPFILTHILDNVIETLNIPKVVFFGVIMIICAIGACFGHVWANRVQAGVSRDFSKNMRSQLFEKTLYLSARDTDKFTIPSLESRITSDTYHVHHFVGVIQRLGVRAPILLIGGLVMSFIMDPILALAMVATLPFICITVIFLSKKGVPLYSKVQTSVDNMVRVVREDAQGVRVIKALSKGEYENNRYDNVNKALAKSERKASMVTGIVNPLMTLLMNLGIVAVIGLSAYRVASGHTTTPTVIAFVEYFTMVSNAMISLSRMFVMYGRCAASAKRIEEVIENPDDFIVNKEKAVKDYNHVTFENVNFSYFGKSNNLENININLKKGEHLGIIGATGSGKSTLIKLLMRFYEPDSGSIRINGKDVSSYTREQLTKMFGVALQNDFHFAGTIEDNIRFDRDIPSERIVWASKIAQAHDFIMEKPEGYQHQLTQKGTNLSGGQKQRILIARAIAGNPEILILDDSSSALDYKTDATLRKALKENLTDSTIITVAQRVSSIKDCNHIIVIDQGKIIGQGTHQFLLDTCQEYREISNSQMGGECQCLDLIG